MTPSLTAQLFGVPMLIIGVILGCAVVVVLLFGSIASDRERSIGSLLTTLETSSGERTAGVLLPGERELWQVGRELALRLNKKEAELSSEELDQVVVRLSALVSRDAARTADLSRMGRQRLTFIMQALALTGSAGAVAPLVEVLSDGHADTRVQALRALGGLRSLPEARQALPRIVESLADSNAAVRTSACVLISSLADEGDAAALEALDGAYYDQEREVRWNAALALARLGSLKGKPLLLDMLDRSYWEREVKVRMETSPGTVREYPMPPPAVDRYLSAAVEAASGLNDEELWTEISELSDDSSVQVRESVRTAAQRRAAPKA
jgi:HEAT repeat protein